MNQKPITVEQVAHEIFGKSFRSLSVYVRAYVRREAMKRKLGEFFKKQKGPSRKQEEPR